MTDSIRNPRRKKSYDHVSFSVSLPPWVAVFLSETAEKFVSPESRMRLVIRLADLNVKNGTGGPFAAAVFDQLSGKLIAPGVNLVLSSGLSSAHAEIIAISLAQKRLGNYDLGEPGKPVCELVTSTTPCAMCFGAIVWSGVRRIVCGAREQDARDIGFDEGDKIPSWAEALAARGISVQQNVCHDEAVAVLRRYAESGGTIYNGRQGK